MVELLWKKTASTQALGVEAVFLTSEHLGSNLGYNGSKKMSVRS